MRPLRCLLAVGSATVLAAVPMIIASSAGTAAAPGAAARPATHRVTAQFLSEARTALVRYLRHDHPQIRLVKPGAPTLKEGTSSTTSYNWSGYADVSGTTGTFSRVSGQWRTPVVTCTAEDQLTSEWVGLDGFSNATVEQDGTLDWCFEGTPTYFTWYEMYPAGTIEVGTSLRPGDLIAASVSRAGTTYTLALTDFTRPANSFSTTATCAAITCQDTSAEWIAERPEFGTTGIAPLANYYNWGLSNARQTAGGTPGTIASYPTSYKINMIDSTDTYQLSTASPLIHGNSFITYWRNSY
jgi:hypothetical protein